MGKLGLAAPVYATLPVAKLGHLYMYDHVLSRQAVSDFDTFDLDDVDFAFNSVETLKYSENRMLSGRCALLFDVVVSWSVRPDACLHVECIVGSSNLEFFVKCSALCVLKCMSAKVDCHVLEVVISKHV
jgi:hypothetical protein